MSAARLDCAILAFVCLVVPCAYAERVVATPDTEAAALRSNLIVEGVLVQQWTGTPRSFGDCGVWSLKVCDVIAGPFAPSAWERLHPRDESADRPQPATRPTSVAVGDVITMDGINRHSITADLLPEKKTRRLRAGDRLILFLVTPGRDQIVQPVAGAPAAEWIVPDMALRYVTGDATYPFVQFFGNPNEGFAMTSAFITMTEANFKDFRPISPAVIRQRATTAIREAAGIDAK